MFEIREYIGAQTHSGPHLLITAGVHGDEFESIYAVQRLIARFAEKQDFCGKLTLIPIANEAAFRRGHRVAEEDGLDLARTFPGKPDGSLTERVADKLAALIRSADFYIDMHTGGTELAVWPLTGYMMHRDEHVLEKQREMARAFGLNFVWGTAANLDGRSLSVARDAGVPAIYTEYLGGGRSSEAGVQAYVQGCLNVMSAIDMTEQDLEISSLPQVVEDTSENSGHMQLAHPAPSEGLFTPKVELGQLITEGEALGEISDFTGENTQPIVATCSGHVIVLRTFPRVRIGDSCGVIA